MYQTLGQANGILSPASQVSGAKGTACSEIGLGGGGHGYVLLEFYRRKHTVIASHWQVLTNQGSDQPANPINELGDVTQNSTTHPGQLNRSPTHWDCRQLLPISHGHETAVTLRFSMVSAFPPQQRVVRARISLVNRRLEMKISRRFSFGR